MRSCACDTASRPCVRTVLCNPAFLLVPSSPSTDSAADCSALFAGFAGTIDECDFFVPCIIGYGLRPSRRGPGHDYRGQNEDLPVPAQKTCVHAGGLMTTRGDCGPCAGGPKPAAFCTLRLHRHPGLYCLRRSIPRLYAPLSTLRRYPRGYLRMTRGRCGSLVLHRNGLAPSTSCRPSRRSRGSMAGLCTPLPTLRPYPRGHRRTARGRCGSLFLHHKGLSPSTPCRFIRTRLKVF